MRDVLNDLEAGRLLSDPDPVRRAQIQMRTPPKKRAAGETPPANSSGLVATIVTETRGPHTGGVA